MIDPYKYEPTKPLYILIKVEVDKEIVYNQEKADTYAINHCNKMEYELVDHYYPDDEQYPYIAKWRNTSDYWQSLPTAL